MKYTILFVLAAFILSALWACSGNKNQVTTTVDSDGVARKVVSISPKLLAKKWKMIRTKDSYNGEWQNIDSDHKVVQFTKEGRYTEQRPGNELSEGSYSLNGDKVTVEHSGNQVPLNYQVYKVDKKKLTLTIQGRHGKVFQEFERIK